MDRGWSRLFRSEQSVSPKEEFVGFFRRDENGNLVEMTGGQYNFQVIQGRVRFTRRPVGDVRDGMTVSAFFEELKKLDGY